MGYFANRHSFRTNRPTVRIPKTMRQMTVADFQGKAWPPNWRPRRSMRVPPTMVRLPTQSMALRPVITGVRGVCRLLRKKAMIRKATPSKGRLM